MADLPWGDGDDGTGDAEGLFFFKDSELSNFIFAFDLDVDVDEDMGTGGEYGMEEGGR